MAYLQESSTIERPEIVWELTYLQIFIKSQTVLHKQFCASIFIQYIYVVVQFYPWFKFDFLLFWGIVMYDNEFETKENKI